MNQEGGDGTQTPTPDNASPWQKDISERFTDPEVAAAVDGFLREKVQPYVTQVEQRTAGNEKAAELYKDLHEDPEGTWYALTSEIFGEESATKLVDTYNQTLEATGDPAAAEEAAQEVAEQKTDALSPEDRAALDAIKNDRLEKEYHTAVDQFIEAQPEGSKPVKELFHPHIVAAEGDLDAALASYQHAAEKLREQYGITPEQVAAQQQEPPPTIGSEQQSAAASTTPQQKDYNGNLNAAIDDMFDDLKSGAPPTVGSV